MQDDRQPSQLLVDLPKASGTHHCDIFVIGGGIHGVGVAQAAAAAGYSTILIEQTALGAGTSSRSSKLIHGGLRYLEQFQWRLVSESIHERELLIRLAPGLVHRHPFHIPVYPETSRRPWVLRSGLSLYALLGGLREGTRFSSLPQSKWTQLDGLTTHQLQAVFCYYDAKTDDRLLTAAVMQSAQQLGAQLFCPAQFLQANIDTNGCTVQFSCGNELHTCQALTVVNAAGPWANQVLDRCRPAPAPFPVDLVQGTHIEIAGQITMGSYYLEAPHDRRAVFVMPWYDRTLVGTTENVFEGDPGQVRPLGKEIGYLQEVYQHYFPGRPLQLLDAWAGLRVLPQSGNKAFARSRETQLPVDQNNRPRIVSIFGGKLTGYRITAQKVLTRLAPTLPRRTIQATTHTLKLTAPPS
jgi:glycerol-3-phosphate dehydrogenase